MIFCYILFKVLYIVLLSFGFLNPNSDQKPKPGLSRVRVHEYAKKTYSHTNEGFINSIEALKSVVLNFMK
jgi:hypothetical protein